METCNISQIYYADINTLPLLFLRNPGLKETINLSENQESSVKKMSDAE